jgi:DNA repair protein RadC
LIKEHDTMTVAAPAISEPQSMFPFGVPFPDIGSAAIFGLFDLKSDASGLGELARSQGSNDPQIGAPHSFSNGNDAIERPAGELETHDPERLSDDECLTDQRWKAICSKLLSVSEESISDVDLLTLLLSHYDSKANSRGLATLLIRRFETFGNVVSARCSQITGAAEIQPELIDFLRLVRAAGTRLAREEISNRPILDAWDKLLPYLHAQMAHQTEEQFRLLFLDRRNVLIMDEVQHRGTIDHTPLYPREVAKRALELDASAVIMAHNHPSNHPAPSKGDIAMTRMVNDTLERLGIVLHDHIIISRRGHSSFRCMGLLGDRAA